MNELRRHKKSDKIKWVFTGIAFVLVAVMLTGICLQLFGTGKQKPSEWFKKPDTEQTTPVPNDTTDNGGLVVTPASTKTMRLTAKALSASADNGATTQSGDYTLTATVMPDNADNKAVDWSFAWVNANSEWATGKTVTDYIEVTPQSDGSTTATVKSKLAFGEKINITVTSRDNEEITATCVCDYSKKVTGGSISIGDIGFDSKYQAYFRLHNVQPFVRGYIESDIKYNIAPLTQIAFTYSDYTLDDTFDMSVCVKINPSVFNQMKSAIGKDITYIEKVDGEVSPIKNSNGVSLGVTYDFQSLIKLSNGNALDTETRNAVKGWLSSNLSADLFYFEIVSTGTYSSYTKNMYIHFTASALTIDVTSVTVDNQLVM